MGHTNVVIGSKPIKTRSLILKRQSLHYNSFTHPYKLAKSSQSIHQLVNHIHLSTLLTKAVQEPYLLTFCEYFYKIARFLLPLCFLRGLKL